MPKVERAARGVYLSPVASEAVTIDELWHFARVCRVAAVLRPYLEVLVR